MILIALLGGQGEVCLPLKKNHRRKTVRAAIGKLPSSESEHAPLLHRMRQNLSPSVLARVAQIPKDGGSRRSLSPEHQLKCHQYKVGFNDVYGRMSWDSVAPTLTRCCHNPSKGRFLHPTENRGITLLEAMLLQGFPATYKFLGTGIGKIASMIGELLPPQLAKAQGEHIRGLLGK